MTTQKSLVLVDGSSYLFRAFFALPPLTNSKGEPTGAIYGVLNMLKKLLKDYNPKHIAVVFDPKGKTFRSEMYAEYKANRVAMPDDLRVQIQPLFKAIQALGFPLIIIDGVEADDVIGTMACQANREGLETLISTGDKDLAQLVNDKITLVNTMNDKMMDRAGVIEKFGVTPEQIIDYLALVGDTSDNVPGIPKVGPKTAEKWLKEYGSLDSIVKNADQITGKVGENLRGNLELLELSKKLVTIKTDVVMDIDFHTLKMQEQNRDELIELYRNFEFRRWLDELQKDEPQEKVSEKKYTIITDQKIFEEWLKKLNKAAYFSFNTETSDFNAISGEIVGISFAVQPYEAAYVPMAHNALGAPQQLNRDWVLQQLKPLFSDPNKIIIGENLKYDFEVLNHYGISVQAKFCDTMLESYVLNSTTSRHDVASLATKYLGETITTLEDVVGKGAKMLAFNQISIDSAAAYSAGDADITLRLHHKLYPEVAAEKKLSYVFNDIEMPVLHVLTKMECHGVLIDQQKLKNQSNALAKRILELQEAAFSEAGSEFNLSSPKQLQAILFDKMQLPILSKTPTGQPSTSEDVLSELAVNFSLPKLILEYRSLSKLKSTYADALPLQINPRTGRVHTSYNQAVTATGRLSSTDPNLQNIPIRSEEGRKIRQAFIAPAGYKILAADYSQVELRIVAHLSKDPGLLSAFSKGIDVHAATASEIFAVPLEKVTADHRRHAKAINFGLLYGMSAFGLSQQIGVETGAAKEYMDIYFARYPKVKEYMEHSRKIAAEQGYVETIFGRRLYTPEINASNMMRRRAAERQAINAPLQGSAADIIKLAMIDIQQWLEQEEPATNMIMQVHDELIFEIPENKVTQLSQKIQEKMQNAAKLDVPLLVDVGIGDNWDEAH